MCVCRVLFSCGKIPEISVDTSLDESRRQTSSVFPPRIVISLPSVVSRSMVDPRYEHWTAEHAKAAAKNKFGSYETLLSLVKNWREVRLSVVEHSATILTQINEFGKQGFYSRTVRFGGPMPAGDMLFVSMSEQRLRRIMSNIIIALQSVRGEGRSKRLGIKDSESSTGGEDSALNVAHQLSELADLLEDDEFLKSHVFTQDKFELTLGLKWTGS